MINLEIHWFTDLQSMPSMTLHSLEDILGCLVFLLMGEILTSCCITFCQPASSIEESLENILICFTNGVLVFLLYVVYVLCFPRFGQCYFDYLVPLSTPQTFTVWVSGMRERKRMKIKGTCESTGNESVIVSVCEWCRVHRYCMTKTW